MSSHGWLKTTMNVGVLFTVALFLGVEKIPSRGESAIAGTTAPAQLEKPFPEPDFVLRDTPHKEPKSGVQMSPGGQITIMQGVGTPTVINSLSFSADGGILAAGKDFGRAVMWDVQNRKFLRALETGQGIVTAVALTPDGSALVTSGKADNFSLKFWDVATGKLLKTLNLDDDFVHTSAYDSTGKRLIVSDNTAKTFIWDVTTAASIFTRSNAYGAGFSQDEKLFVTANPKGFSVWNTADWTLARTTLWSAPIPTIVALHSGTDRIAIYREWGIHVIRLSTGEPIEGVTGALPNSSTGYPKFVAFSADGLLLYLNFKDRIWVWDTQTNKICGTPVMYSGAGAISRDHRWLAGAKDDSILSRERTDGVWIWETTRLLAACNIQTRSSK